MNRKRWYLVAVLVLLLLTPQVLRADDGLTLETLAERIEILFRGQNDLHDRLAAVETQIAPTPTRTPRPTATPRIAATATAKAKATAQSRFRSRGTATAVARSRATATARARPTSTPTSQSGARKYGLCSFPNVPNPPYRDLDCDVWHATYILISIELGRNVRIRELESVADRYYDEVRIGIENCGVRPSLFADYLAVAFKELRSQGKPSRNPSKPITYLLGEVSSPDFAYIVENMGCVEGLAAIMVLTK